MLTSSRADTTTLRNVSTSSYYLGECSITYSITTPARFLVHLGCYLPVTRGAIGTMHKEILCFLSHYSNTRGSLNPWEYLDGNVIKERAQQHRTLLGLTLAAVAIGARFIKEPIILTQMPALVCGHIRAGSMNLATTSAILSSS